MGIEYIKATAHLNERLNLEAANRGLIHSKLLGFVKFNSIGRRETRAVIESSPDGDPEKGIYYVATPERLINLSKELKQSTNNKTVTNHNDGLRAEARLELSNLASSLVPQLERMTSGEKPVSECPTTTLQQLVDAYRRTIDDKNPDAEKENKIMLWLETIIAQRNRELPEKLILSLTPEDQRKLDFYREVIEKIGERDTLEYVGCLDKEPSGQKHIPEKFRLLFDLPTQLSKRGKFTVRVFDEPVAHLKWTDGEKGNKTDIYIRESRMEPFINRMKVLAEGSEFSVEMTHNVDDRTQQTKHFTQINGMYDEIVEAQTELKLKAHGGFKKLT